MTPSRRARAAKWLAWASELVLVPISLSSLTLQIIILFHFRSTNWRASFLWSKPAPTYFCRPRLCNSSLLPSSCFALPAATALRPLQKGGIFLSFASTLIPFLFLLRFLYPLFVRVAFQLKEPPTRFLVLLFPLFPFSNPTPPFSLLHPWLSPFSHTFKETFSEPKKKPGSLSCTSRHH
ncbi:hypothetical protein DL89DRAFT_28215 [Linderina pennispora]|uniref:Transmembrane protein n=1 Tax=Linderina pennispora TaxID=61395 RepID=A0A1Y1W4B1_9FUNG|nr:uncharacterized protein DL89DRAFT_28215 [Linderina pennispora]ORX68222.1 hypothetical protein DL89DRAFT_28215 [Linderina pennispora]